MLPKKSRLTALEVRAILKEGRAARARTVSVKFIRSAPSKAAVVVSSKVAKSAVLRNRLRRAGFATLRSTLPQGIQAVFFLHKPVVDPADFAKLCSTLS